MKILHIHDRPLAGAPVRLHGAQAATWPDATIRRIQLAGPDADAQMGFAPGETRDQLEGAIADVDVIHLHQLGTLATLPTGWQKPAHVRVLLTIHGDPDRHERAEPLPDWIDAVTVVTPELLAFYPEATFLPNVIRAEDVPRCGPRGDLTWTLYRWSAYRPDKHRGWQEVTERLPRPWRLEQASPQLNRNADILAAMAGADVCWDHLNGYFGMTAIEASAMGVVPIVWLTPQVEHALEARFGAVPPWLSGSPETILAQLARWTQAPGELIDAQVRVFHFWHDRWQPAHLCAAWRALYEGSPL